MRGAAAAIGYADSHLCSIESISNGFVVRFPKAKKVTVKSRGIDDMGLDPEMKEFLRNAAARMREIGEGESWKVPDRLRNSLDKIEGSSSEVWSIETQAIACGDMEKLLGTIRIAEESRKEINRLRDAGEFDPNPF